MKLSIVTTLYHSAPYIRPFYERCLAQMEAAGLECEFIFVNDGSPDDSAARVRQLGENDPRVALVDLSRNFGHHKAMMAGLQHARGDFVFLIDVDLEEPPECFAELWEVLRGEQADVAFGVQKQRHGRPLHDLMGSAYYWIYNKLADAPMENDQLTARVMTRAYVDALLEHREQVFSIESIWAATGFRQVAVPILKSEHKGSSTYTFRKKLALAVNGITSFSSKPLLMIAYMGLAMVGACGIYILVVLYQYFFLNYKVGGYTSLIISIWLVGGFIIFNLGIVSTYLSIIFREVKQRPYVIVREVWRKKEPGTPS